MTRRRLIPACAGKTMPDGGLANRLRAHPRVCGENAWTDLDTNGAAGSSPRVRGKPTGRRVGLCRGGLIPACAGKTLNDLEF